MWLLVRAPQSDPDGGQLQVRSPDSPVTDAADPEPWQWTVSGDPRDRLTLETNPAICQGTVERAHIATTIQRRAGTIVVLAPGGGWWRVSSGTGAWRRELCPGDVFLAEDDRDERLDVAPLDTDETEQPAFLTVITVSPFGGGDPLRWIP